MAGEFSKSTRDQDSGSSRKTAGWSKDDHKDTGAAHDVVAKRDGSNRRGTDLRGKTGASREV
jgi:hypothetical protein